MSDMTQAIVPKSDQLNADDLIAGPKTIKITSVQISAGQEQPVSIFFEGDNKKPWKPCKSMSRVLVLAWGPDGKKYAGRSLTLFREPSVKWGGLEVGGIRISHMEGLDEPVTMVLTATKGSRKPYTVRPLVVERDEWLDTINAATTIDALKTVYESAWGDAKSKKDRALATRYEEAYKKRKADLEEPAK